MGVFSSTANIVAQSTDPGALGAGAIWSDTDADTTYRRSDDNSEWVQFTPAKFILGDEASSTPVTVDGEAASDDGRLLIGNTVQLPTTSSHWIITAVEWDNGATVSGNMIGGVMLIDANPPVETVTRQICDTGSVAISGTDAVQKASVLGSPILPGGLAITGFVIPDNATTVISYDTIAGNGGKYSFSSGSNTPVAPIDDSAWTSTGIRIYLKIYYKPVTIS